MTKRSIPAQLASLSESVRAAEEKARSLVLGRRVRIVSAYNGQPFGRSRKPLTGKVFEVVGVSLDGSAFSLWLSGNGLSIGIDEVEFLDETRRG